MAAHIAAPNMTPEISDLVAELKMTHSTVHLSAISLESANVILLRASINGCTDYGSSSLAYEIYPLGSPSLMPMACS